MFGNSSENKFGIPQNPQERFPALNYEVPASEQFDYATRPEKEPADVMSAAEMLQYFGTTNPREVEEILAKAGAVEDRIREADYATMGAPELTHGVPWEEDLTNSEIEKHLREKRDRR